MLRWKGVYSGQINVPAVCPTCTHILGHVIAHVRRWFPTAAGRVLPQVRVCGIFDGQFSFYRMLHTLPLSGASTIGPLVAVVPSGLVSAHPKNLGK
jgi:hypothetical protein